ncbi:glycosyl transferase family 1 [Flavobacterium sediminis]|uniref:Glycosyl transferase family 1 n=1 Tax=Flavobacterium sediminis TaxID=2201181 RepID=A0A2U8QS70_9FLAO|nr:glycosyltransferase [Flavobacterium sediminis]AWM12695.1 glycosyl transferase family 1 [Flavobacterium sediminis]
MILKEKTGTYKSIKNFLRSKSEDPIDENGILVFPEIFGPDINCIRPDMKKVIFNQNCFYTFDNSSSDSFEKGNIYTDKSFLGSIVVSENSEKYLNFVYPDSKVYRIKLGIDKNLFSCESNSKEKTIAYMPRKRKEDITQIIQILKAHQKIKDWQFTEIDNKSEKEVSDILKKSTFFLSLNHKEGFGLPSAEAMAAGNIVIGFSGQGGEEYFKPEFSFEIKEGEIIEFVETIESITSEYNNNPSLFKEKAEKASTFITSNYSMEKEEESILAAWQKILQNTNSIE